MSKIIIPLVSEIEQIGSEKSSEKIIALITHNKNITISEMAKKLNISTRAVEKQIAKLKKEAKIRRVGPDRGGYWEIVE